MKRRSDQAGERRAFARREFSAVRDDDIVRHGGIKGALPLDALFFGDIIFPKTQPSVVVAFLRGDAAE